MIHTKRVMKKRATGYLGYIGDDLKPQFCGDYVMNHYKDHVIYQGSNVIIYQF